jgi:NAD(P)-dependent dehydrogenase (short-subunit alcohol dehydrogenase family)
VTVAAKRLPRGLGGRAGAILADVSIAVEVERTVQQIEQQLGPVAILVNNAGIARPRPFDRISK